MESRCERIRRLRKRAGISQESVAAAAGLTRTGYQQIESGKNGRTLDKLPKIAKALGCRIDDLFPEMDDVQGAGEDKPVSADGFEDDSLDRLTM